MSAISQQNLYQPEKYKVWLGEGASAGFCTIWNEPEALFNCSTELRKKAAIVGTLYSRFGVNVILRNLALNPQIRKLYVWGYGPLSRTQFGIAGKSILESIWSNGIGNDGRVSGTDFKLEKEINSEIINNIRKHVELIDVSSLPFDSVLQNLETEAPVPYMEPVRFADAKQEEVNVFPSEEVGWVVHGRKVIDVWERVVERIMRYGSNKGSQYGLRQKELIGVSWVISDENPLNPELPADWTEGLKKVTGANLDAIREYHDVFLSPDTPEGISYTYGNRLMRYPKPSGFIDQIDEVVIAQLKSSPDSRRAFGITVVPAIDWNSKEPPCLTQIQCLQTNGKLHLLAVFRSHDIFKAAIPNAFGLRTLQKYIADQTGFELGKLQITSQSAHIYESDWEDAKKLARCGFWEREPDMAFDPDAEGDPRGNVIVSVRDEKIIAVLQDPSGSKLAELTGKTAKAIYRKIAHMGLLYQPGHMFDIGAELQKAEIALRKNIEYIQDRPLKF